jgi:hypothetical protein
LSHDTSESGYSAAVDLTLDGDTVVVQSESVYDQSGNLIISKRLDRKSTYGGTGPLIHGATQARGDYTVIWYDCENRKTHHSYYGNNGDQDITSQPVPVPIVSDSNQLLTKYEYFKQAR